ncbi:MAG TPA: JAB domain-containing protein [Gemmatimonadaceae bacterium]|jgi:hypothetical protein|nr:JAB domain-containing protein [Gemmatimonadaceae bacterium]
MARVQVAYEQAHECKEGCNCAKDSGYLDAVQQSLADLGSDDPSGDVARHAKYVRGAQKARLEPKQAAAMILAMSRPDEGYQPRYRFEDVAETAAHEYIAVDSRGKKVFGPTRDYGEAKLHADRSGGTVRFEMSASESAAEKSVLYWRHENGQWYGSPHRAPYARGDWFANVFQELGGKWVALAKTDVERELPENVGSFPSEKTAKLGSEKAYLEFLLKNPEYLPLTSSAAPPSPSGLQPGSRVTIELPLRPAGSGGSGHPKLGYVVKLGKRGALVATADGEEWYPIDRLTSDGYVSPDYARELPYEKPIRFHRGRREGTYEASAGHMGTMVCSQRSPNRRANPPVLPWVVMIKKVEIVQAASKREVFLLAQEWAKSPKPAEEPPAAAECTPVIRNGRVERSPDCGSTGVRLASAKDVWLITKDKYARQGHETFEVLGANLNNEMVDGPVTVAVGQTSGVRVEPEAIIIAALGLKNGGSTQIWCCHPHPGGSPNPSAADRNLDKAIREAFGTLKSLEYKGQVVCTRTTFKRV